MISGLSEYLDKREDVSALLASIESIIGKPLNTQIIQDVFMLTEEYNFDNDRVREFFTCLKNKGVLNHNYLLKMAETWNTNNITSASQNTEDEERRLAEIPEGMLRVFEALGISVRIPKDYEYEFYNSWVSEYKTDIELIVKACSVTKEKSDIPSMAYANAIIKNWHTSGVHTVEEYEKMCEQNVFHKKEQGDVPVKKSKNSFHNFNERSYDFNELMKSAIT